MQIGILSDTHNNVLNLRKALSLFRDAGVTQLIHCGDMTSIETAKHMAGFDVVYVSGNVDQSSSGVRDAVWMLNPNGNDSAEIYRGTIAGVSLAATHSHIPGALDQLIRSGKYAYVFHGHTHRRRDERIGRTRVVNPGALGGNRPETRSVALVDLGRDTVEFIHVSDF